MHRALKLGFAAVMLATGYGCALAPREEAGAELALLPPGAPQEFRVSLAPGAEPQSGRLIAVATPVSAIELPDSLPHPRGLSASGPSTVAAQEAPLVSSEGQLRFVPDILAFPQSFSRIEPGEYWVQVRLDVNHNAAYRFSDPENDYVSTPMKVMLPSQTAMSVTLAPERDVIGAGAPPASPDAEADAQIRPFEFESPSLTEFWGRPISIRGLVLLPPDYDSTRDIYPAVYRTEGFGASFPSLTNAARRHYALMKTGDTPPMIRVFLDHSSPWGTHEFADSVNTGPWGKALTEELIPWLEQNYRMDRDPFGRFVTGHSSGGWFAMWQQVRYPHLYGGAWARAPDPVDFRSFTGINIYAADANAYRRPDGAEQFLVRDADGKPVVSFRDFALRENVLGEFGGQIDSFDWVFSPRADDGRPRPLFDRMTGEIDPAVAAYWRENYDISHIVRRDWDRLRPSLEGKIHITMGTMDTFHLDESTKIFELEMKALGAYADVYWMEGRGHGNLDRIGDDPMGLEKKIAWEMWAIARPGSPLKPPPGAAVRTN